MRRRRKGLSPRRLTVQQSTVIPISIAAGLIAGVSPAAPTGQSGLDLLYVVAGVAFVTWVAASAPWWVLLIATGLAVVVGASVPLVLVGLVAFGLAAWIGTKRGELTPLRALAAGISLNVMLRGELEMFFGASAVVSMVAVGLLLFGGTIRRRSRDTAVILTVLAVAAVFLVGGTLVFGAAVFSARNDLTAAANEAQTGIRLLTETQELEAASAVLDSAALRFRIVDRSINSLWTEPARLVPIVAQQRRALVSLSSGAAAVSSSLLNELERLDLNRLRPTGGTFDLVGYRETEAGLERFVTAMDRAIAGARASESPWLAGTVATQLTRLETELSRERDRSAAVLEAIGVVPPILGESGQRRYLVMFTTPAEARGHGGFMGNYAEITARGGVVEMTAFGRTGELNAAGTAARRVDGPDDWVNRYGRFGFRNGPNGTTGTEPWSNVTVSPNFPSTAQVAAQMYPESGGGPVDGVVAVDVDTLVALMSFTGAVEVTPAGGEPRVIFPDQARQFLLYDQYRLIDDIEREDLLAVLAEEVFTRLAQGALGGPVDLFRQLGPEVERGGLTVWMRDRATQDVMDSVGIAGRLADPAGNDAIALAFNNGSASKLELFFDSTLDYALEVDSTGFATGTITVTLTNSASTGGWPDGVIGNYVGLPTGTNRLMVTLFTALPPVASTLDGEDEPADLLGEAGYFTTSWFVIIDPGQTRTLTLEVAGPVNPDMESITVWTPAMVREVPVTVRFDQAGRPPVVENSARPGTIVHPIR